MTKIPVFSSLPGGLGASCAVFDLEQSLAQDAHRAILAAFLKHKLLVFRSQRLSPDRMRDFAAAFGEVEGNIFRKPDGSTLEDVHIISNLGASGLPDEDSYIKSNYNWHTDKSYLPVPALLTMLQAIELPPVGGDTEFADMTRAYASLPAEMRNRIDGCQAIHSFEYMRSSTNDRPLTAAERAATPPVSHPLVRTHPETGEKSLYLGMYCSHIEGMDEAQGRALIRELQAHATSAPFVYAHRWEPGDLVFWDNRCLLHRATMGFDAKKHRRVLQRAVVRGTRPV
jgi:alpha-ketoglutarate-dependent taurine dioxygenase